VFSALLVLRLITTAFDLSVFLLPLLLCYKSLNTHSRYRLYKSFTARPLEVRADLRDDIKAKQQGDFDMSEIFLRRCALLFLRVRLCLRVNLAVCIQGIYYRVRGGAPGRGQAG
jgi:hypothetical protein